MRIVLLVLLIFSYSCSHKDTSPKKNVLDIDSNRVLTQLEFLTRRIDFGVVKNDTLLTGKYSFVNNGPNDLKIDYVTPDCSCTSYFISSKLLHPHDTGVIVLKLSTKNKSGKETLYATVSANTVMRLYSLEMLVDVK